MNCKFHPAAEAVATCAVCGTEMCSSCDLVAFFRTEDDKPLCHECSLKEAEKDFDTCKWYQKDTLIRGIIGIVIWCVGVYVAASVIEWLGLLILLCAGILFSGKSLFTSEEKGFFEKVKDIFFSIILGTLLLPFMVILCLIHNKWKMIKIKAKIKKIKSVLGNTN